jgi:hypothetical protein
MGSIPTNLLNNIYLYPPNQYSQHFHSHLLTHTEWQKVSGLRYMARVEPEVEPGKAMSFSFSKCPFHSLFSSMNLCVCVCVCVCVCFLLVILLFKMVPKHSSEVLSSVSKCKKI